MRHVTVDLHRVNGALGAALGSHAFPGVPSSTHGKRWHRPCGLPWKRHMKSSWAVQRNPCRTGVGRVDGDGPGKVPAASARSVSLIAATRQMMMKSLRKWSQ